MIDYLSQVKPLEDAGMTDAEIAALLAASTASDIPIADLENFLDFESLAKRNAITGAWEGVLPDEIINNAFGLSDGLSSLFNHINKPRSVVIDTTVSPWASDAAALTDGLVAAGLITAQQQTDFYALGGGLPNAGLTEAEVTQSRVDWEAAEAARQAEEAARQAELLAMQQHSDWVSDYQGRFNLNVAAVLDDSPNRDNAALVAALRTLADDLENNPWSP
jgi:hypothetical protein